MIGIINYGLGNLQAFATVYKRLNIPCVIVSDKKDCASVTKLILPGVGSFDYAMERFRSSGLFETIEHLVLQSQMPILGVCVGMQMLADSSDEGISKGLGWIQGKVKRLITTDPIHVKLPHMGWNQIKVINNNKLFLGLESKYFYFLHSYYFDPIVPNHSIATVYYSNEFACAVCKDNVYGVQFHPEKSHEFGMALLKNFAEL